MADYQQLRSRYQEILSVVSQRRTQVFELSSFLVSSTNWESAVSSKNKSSFLLAEHSIVVAETLFLLAKAVNSKIPVESIAIVGLFHDIGKLGGFIEGKFEPRYLDKDRGLEYNTKLAEIPIGVRSFYLIERFVPLSEPEIQAIVNIEGLYNPASTFMRYRETELALLAHWADYHVSHIVERSGDFNYSYSPWLLDSKNEKEG